MKTKVIVQSGVPVQFFVIGFVVILLATGAIVAGYYLGIIMLLFGVLLFTYKDGTEINFRTRQIREFTSIASLRFGTWQNIHPDLVFQLRTVTMNYGRSFGGVVQNEVKNRQFKLMLQSETGKFVCVKISDKRQELEELETVLMLDFTRGS